MRCLFDISVSLRKKKASKRKRFHHDRHDAVGRDPSGGAVEGELANWDAHAVHAQVAEAQNARPVSHHDHVHV